MPSSWRTSAARGVLLLVPTGSGLLPDPEAAGATGVAKELPLRIGEELSPDSGLLSRGCLEFFSCWISYKTSFANVLSSIRMSSISSLCSFRTAHAKVRRIPSSGDFFASRMPLSSTMRGTMLPTKCFFIIAEMTFPFAAAARAGPWSSSPSWTDTLALISFDARTVSESLRTSQWASKSRALSTRGAMKSSQILAAIWNLCSGVIRLRRWW
mmetsp:Transcript_17519/g.35793  ORF Transcript_17519/g.35793 Transcript_17519/m.35793 type:complete len:212 (-) Transcript_17519:788-1423(-)